MSMNSKKLIPLITASIILMGSAKSFAADSTPHDFGVKLNQTANKTWTIKFTEDVDSSVIQNDNITVTDEADNSAAKVTLEKGGDNKTVIIKAPTEGYKSGHTYLIDVKTSIKSAKSKNLKRESKLHFTVTDNSQQADQDVMFVKAMGENGVVVKLNKDMDSSILYKAVILDQNGNDITDDHRVYNNDKRMVITTKSPMYTPSTYKVKLGDKTYDFSAAINQSDAVRVLSAQAVGEKLIKVKLSRPIEDCDKPKVSMADSSGYMYNSVNWIDKSTMDIALNNRIYKGDTCTLNINGSSFNVQGTVEQANKVQALSAEQDNTAPGKISVKLNRECFSQDIPEIKIVDAQGNELKQYQDFDNYDSSKDVMTIDIKSAEKQTGNYKVTIGDKSFDLNLKAVGTAALNVVSVQAITPNMLKITYDREDDSGLMYRASEKILPAGSTDEYSNIYITDSNGRGNVKYEKLNTKLAQGQNYVFVTDGKSYDIQMMNNQYNASVSDMSAVDENTIKFKLNSNFPKDSNFPEDVYYTILVAGYNQYGERASGAIWSSYSGDVTMSFRKQVFSPDAYYLGCGDNLYALPSPVSKDDAWKITSMTLTGDKHLTITFNKQLNQILCFGTYNYYDHSVSYNYKESGVSGNSLNIVTNDSIDPKTTKVQIAGNCYYISDYIK